MSRSILLRPQAELDLSDAYHWYEARRENLGKEFVSSVEDVFSRIGRNPRMYPAVHDEIRRAQVRRFPYAVYYIFDADRVEILAVVHTSRNPSEWQSRL